MGRDGGIDEGNDGGVECGRGLIEVGREGWR